MEDTELDSSELGTYDYWKKTYAIEVNNYEENGDPGDVWFGEDSAQRVIDWICSCGVSLDTPLIDLGCGNGYSLMELARQGFTNLLGVDYCEEAIVLAEKVTKEEFSIIKYKVFDIINDDVSDLGTNFGIVHDKGTYDAISLNPDNPKENRRKYLEQVTKILCDNGLFIITSCNWTDQELIKQFSEKMKLKCVIPTPQFKFGGKVGSVVSSVVFIKK
ncbi:EEF1A lysine methyltransferase 2 [Galleria mellonella]|uniref:Protein-lysine N-methyltransferase LOC113513742 n=1 Tax=Galleria mellonella TaxID=7137 RepID=A0A6J3C7F8_GALME|nr:EEF1A lysine methyltransferase 2 [Galleria mellonella]XP_052748408.1 EEF1A lysine methyltransferase 2 [Galleria mellonella]XP_052748409.1 EEF1A lysine methyltransferase 2 [Galleria mellonella]